MANTNTAAATKGGKKVRFMDALMAEPIRLQGCPSLIVTRGWAYQWFKKLGCPTNNGGYNSCDYMAMRQSMVNEPLTDLTSPWAAEVIALMERHAS